MWFWNLHKLIFHLLSLSFSEKKKLHFAFIYSSCPVENKIKAKYAKNKMTCHATYEFLNNKPFFVILLNFEICNKKHCFFRSYVLSYTENSFMFYFDNELYSL